jgi:DNA-binding TFAR19-related protein (PDSD5 family)
VAAAAEAVLGSKNSSSASELRLSPPSSCVILLTPYRQQQQDDARQHILQQILHPEAADRLGRIRLVKEERAADIENRLITLAQSGQLRQKVTEAQLKELLNAMSESKEEEKIVVNRRKAWDDDDDLDL